MQDNAIFHHYFINNSISALIRGIADYFGTEFFDRTKEIVIATYDKGVQHYIQRQKNAGEKMAPKFPYIVFDPGLDFEPDPQAGRFFWGYPNFMGQFASQMFRPAIYEDENILVAPILNRYKGRFDIIVWCSSVYEFIDLKIQTFQLFAGQDRIIEPVNIDGHIILPDELLAYTYENPYTGNSYTLDWVNNKSEVLLVKNINKNKMVYPFQITPWIKLLSCDDGSEKYGGSGDEVSNHRLNISCEWECSLPTHVGLIAVKQPNYSQKPVNPFLNRHVRFYMDTDIGYEYSIPFLDPETRDVVHTEKLSSHVFQTFVGSDSTSTDISESVVWDDLVDYKSKYNYILTQTDDDLIHSDPPQNFSVHLLEDVNDAYSLRIYGKYGPLLRDYHWRLTSSGVVEFLGFTLGLLKSGDTIWFAIYEKKEDG